MDSASLDATLKIFSEAFSSTKYLALSSFVLLLYDHLTCLDQEFEFFWKGDWSLTRVLYFLNRYIPPLVFVVQLVYIFTPDLPLDFCTAAIKTATSFLVLGMSVVEAILVTRVYFLWSHSRFVQWSICALFAVCASIAIAFAGKAIHALHGAHLQVSNVFNQPGCINVGHEMYWPIFAPTFIIQTVLFAATVFRVMRPIAAGRNKTVVNRLLRDGAVFYCAVLVSVGYTGIGSILLDDTKISMPALVSNSLLAYHSICASHLILSIHSLAADMGSDPTFLLSNIEISRIAWRPGKNANELLVEVGGDDRGSRPSSPVELDDLERLGKDVYVDADADEGVRKGAARMHTTRIGTLHRNDSAVDLAARLYAASRPGTGRST